MASSDPDPLLRAVDLCRKFRAGETEFELDRFLEEHGELRELLEPMLRETDAAEREQFGDFDIHRELGRGGMGIVYEAEQRSLGRPVALKVLAPHRLQSPVAVARLRREARVAAGLDHPGIAKVYALEEVDGELAIAMERIVGRPLDELIDDLRGSDPRRLSGADVEVLTQRPFEGSNYVTAVTGLARDVADALDHAHLHSIVHRDVKPANILVTPDGRPRLTDFGIAEVPRSSDGDDAVPFSGTEAYAAPEQLRGHGNIDERTDVYALGVTLYELLTLQRPLEAPSRTALADKIDRGDYVRVERANSRVGRDLAAVVHTAMAARPEDRYSSARALADDLDRACSGRPVCVRPVPAHIRVFRWVARNPIASALVAVLLGSTVLVAVLQRRTQNVLARYERLWVGAALEGLEARAAAAWPAWPGRQHEFENLERDLWSMLAMRAELERAIDELRTDGTPAVESAVGRPPHPAARIVDELAAVSFRIRAALEAPDAQGPEADPRVLERLQDELDSIGHRMDFWRRRVERSRSVQLADRREMALHDRLEEQVVQLYVAEDSLLEDLEFRRRWAERVQAETCEAHAQAWEQVRDRVAADSRFNGFDLLPQLGLIPLGRDPTSGYEEFAHGLSGTVPNRDADAKLEIDRDSCIVFVLLPPSRTTPHLASIRQRKVSLAPYFLAKHELSRAHWLRLARGRPGLTMRDAGVHDVRNLSQLEKPANRITWDLADRLLSDAGLQLPTILQWESVATRATEDVESSAPLARTSNLRDLAFARARGVSNNSVHQHDDHFAGLAPVWAMQPTGGFHQLLGNVSEWCVDAFPTDKQFVFRDGDGRLERPAWPGAMRANCGGSWMSTRALLLGDRHSPGSRTRSLGVRPARRVHLRGEPGCADR